MEMEMEMEKEKEKEMEMGQRQNENNRSSIEKGSHVTDEHDEIEKDVRTLNPNLNPTAMAFVPSSSSVTMMLLVHAATPPAQVSRVRTNNDEKATTTSKRRQKKRSKSHHRQRRKNGKNDSNARKHQLPMNSAQTDNKDKDKDGNKKTNAKTKRRKRRGKKGERAKPKETANKKCAGAQGKSVNRSRRSKQIPSGTKEKNRSRSQERNIFEDGTEAAAFPQLSTQRGNQKHLRAVKIDDNVWHNSASVSTIVNTLSKMKSGPMLLSKHMKEKDKGKENETAKEKTTETERRSILSITSVQRKRMFAKPKQWDQFKVEIILPTFQTAVEDIVDKEQQYSTVGDASMSVNVNRLESSEGPAHKFVDSHRRLIDLQNQGNDNKDLNRFFKAAKAGNELIMRELVTNGAVDINALDAQGDTALLLFTQSGKPDSGDGNTNTTSTSQSVSCLRWLVRNGANVACTRKRDKINVLHLLVSTQNITSLHFSVACLEILLSNPACRRIVNARERSCGNTALHLATAMDRTECLQLLLRSGAKVDVRNKKGDTALHIASVRGNLQAISMLLLHGGSPTSQNKHMQQPLHYAARNGDVGCINALIAAGAHVDSLDMMGCSPLVVACAFGRKNVHAVERLLELAEVSLDKRRKRSSVAGTVPALFAAVQSGSCSTVEMLLRHGHSVNQIHAKESSGSPLLQACERNRADMVRLLVRAGANMYHVNRNGLCALQICLAHALQASNNNVKKTTSCLKELIQGGFDVDALLISSSAEKSLTPLEMCFESRDLAQSLFCITNLGANTAPLLKKLHSLRATCYKTKEKEEEEEEETDLWNRNPCYKLIRTLLRTKMSFCQCHKTLEVTDANADENGISGNLPLQHNSGPLVQLIMMDGELTAHSCILRARSSYFRIMLDTNMLEKSSRCIMFPTVSTKTMKLILEYLYTGNIYGAAWQVLMDETENSDELLLVLEFAHVHLLESLEKHCLFLLAYRLNGPTLENGRNTLLGVLDWLHDTVSIPAWPYLDVHSDANAFGPTKTLQNAGDEDSEIGAARQTLDSFFSCVCGCGLAEKIESENSTYNFDLGLDALPLLGRHHLLLLKYHLCHQRQNNFSTDQISTMLEKVEKSLIGMRIPKQESGGSEDRAIEISRKEDRSHAHTVNIFSDDQSVHIKPICTDLLASSCRMRQQYEYEMSELLDNAQEDQACNARLERNLCTNQSEADLTIICDDGIVKAHSMFVVSKSHVFQTMLSDESGGGMRESQTGKIRLSGVNGSTCLQMLRWMYTGEAFAHVDRESDTLVTAIFDCEEIVQLLMLAHCYMIKGLRLQCEHALVQLLSIDNAKLLLSVALQLEDATLLAFYAGSYIIQHLKDISDKAHETHQGEVDKNKSDMSFQEMSQNLFVEAIYGILGSQCFYQHFEAGQDETNGQGGDAQLDPQ